MPTRFFCLRGWTASGILGLLLISNAAFSQQQPLTRQDSALVTKYLQLSAEQLDKGDYKEASRYLNETAFIYWNKNHYRSAIQYYEESLKLNDKVANENGLAMIHNNLGMLYADIEDYPTSLEYFQKTLAARRAKKESVGMVSALINISVVLNNLKRFDESIKGLQEALELCRADNDVEMMRSCYGMLSETYEKAGDTERSLYYFDLYSTFYEFIQKKEIEKIETNLEEERLKKKLEEEKSKIKEEELAAKRAQLAQVEQNLLAYDSVNKALFEKLTHREMELELLEQQNEIAELQRKEQEARAAAEINSERVFRNSVLSGAILLLIIIFLIVRNNRAVKKANKQLAEQKASIEKQHAELAQLNAVKNKLFAIISHDFRSPLASLQMVLKMLDEGDLNEEEKQSLLNTLHTQTYYTADLTENLLNWAKSQMGGGKPTITPVPLRNSSDKAVRLLHLHAGNKKIEIRNSIPHNVKVLAAADMLDIVFRNLISNAVKFTPEGGTVTVSSSVNDRRVVVTVADTGIGMGPEMLQKLFTTELKSQKGTNEEKGSGLGLLLCKEYLEQMGGTLRAESESGKGSTFTFELPLINQTVHESKLTEYV